MASVDLNLYKQRLIMLTNVVNAITFKFLKFSKTLNYMAKKSLGHMLYKFTTAGKAFAALYLRTYE